MIVNFGCCPVVASRVFHLSKASQSSSSPAASHSSPSGPSSRQRTKYCVCLPRRHSSTILSTKNSFALSIMIGSGGCRAHWGKRVSLFSMKGWTSDVWKTGKIFDVLGISSVTVECFLSAVTIWYGPSKRSINLAAHGLSPDLYSWGLCNVDSTTCLPTWKGNVSVRALFAWKACLIFAVRRLSCASASRWVIRDGRKRALTCAWPLVLVCYQMAFNFFFFF